MIYTQYNMIRPNNMNWVDFLNTSAGSYESRGPGTLSWDMLYIV